MNPFRQIIGWLLLFAGVAAIVYGVYASFNIFTGKAGAPQIFTQQAAVTSSGTSSGVQVQLEQFVQQQLKGMIPASSIFGMLNLLAWSIFAGILIFGGAQFASLGIKLIK